MFQKGGRPIFYIGRTLVFVIIFSFLIFWPIFTLGKDFTNDISVFSPPNTPNLSQLLLLQRGFSQSILPDDGVVVQDSWKYADEQTAPTPNFAFDAYMRIDEPADAVSPIQQGVRYVTYNNQENLGGYEAALVMRKSGTDERYRIMFSSVWKEILVWSSKGGILAVKPYPFEVGQTYRVLFGKRGNRLIVTVNHKTIINFFDQTVPIDADLYGVASKEGKSYFGPLRVWDLGALPHTTSPHKTQLSLRTWKGIKWGFDGDEPIFALPGNKALATEVKIVPGYPAQLAIPWYLQNWVDEPFRTDVVVTTTIQEEGDRLRFSLLTKDDEFRKDLFNRTIITVSYDAVKNVYQYDHQSELIIPPSSTLRMGASLDVSDPVFYQIVPSASTQGKQWPVTHRWSVYQQLDGKYYKEPINHFGWYPGYGTVEWWNASMSYMKPNEGSWTVLGDDVANPVLQWLEPDDRKEFSALMCWWGYDLHLNWIPGDGSATNLSSGTYTFKWRLTSLPKTEADILLTSSVYAFPRNTTSSKWLVYTGGVGHVEKFDNTLLKASPFGEFVWGEGSYQDSTLGKDSSTSLRFDGPDFVETTAGESQFTEGFEAGTDYEISAWIKTENVQGEGPGIVFSGQPYYPGVTSTHDWQQIGFVVRPQEPLHTVDFSLHLSGSGRVWFDNFLIRPITPGNPVTPGLNNSSTPLTSFGIPDSQKSLEWKTNGTAVDTAKTVLDLSGHGHHGVRQNVSTTTVDGHEVFHFPGADSQILMRGHQSVSFSPSSTLILWIKPGGGQNGWNVVASGGPKDYDRWRILLTKNGDYTLTAHTPAGIIGDGTKVVEENKWSQVALVTDGISVSLYLNGVLVGSRAYAGDLFGKSRKGYIRLGAMSYAGEAYVSYEGEVSQLKILNKALTGGEILAEFGKGAFAP